MFLHEGTSPAGAYALERPELKWDKVAQALTAAGPGPAAPSSANLELVFDRDAKIDDGRYANNGWLQEFSNPITKLAWGNAALLSPKTAGELGVVDGDVIRLELDGRSLEIPAMLLPGQADYSIAVALGYGQDRHAAASARTWGPMPTSLRTSSAPDIATGRRFP